MKAYSHLIQGKIRFLLCSLAACSTLLCLPARAYIIDNFNDNIKTGWADSLNGGTVTEAGKIFTIATATNSGSLTSSRMTASNYTILSGHTIEFRVKVSTILPAPPDTNTLSVLAFVPTSSGGVMTNGYSLALGSHDFQI